MSTVPHDFAASLRILMALQREALIVDGPPPAGVRRDRLERARRLLVENRGEIADALSSDYGHRSREQTTIADIFAAVESLTNAAANVENWMVAEKRRALAPDAEARIEYAPKGVVGIIGPWNFPYYLVFAPLAGILAAGNRAIIKPSEFTPRSSTLMKRLVETYFDAEELRVVMGGPEESAEFAAAPFDHLLFTGSTDIGRRVMRSAAENLTPITLELGGKSPVIVTDEFDMDEAAARIIAIKSFNAGQICLAPDHVYVPAKEVDAFVAGAQRAVDTQFPEGVQSADYTAIISQRHYDRLSRLIEDARAKGGRVVEMLPPSNGEDRRFPMTLVIDPRHDMLVMQEEIFGPILPVIGYRCLQDVLVDIRSRPHPLSLSYFGRDDETARMVLDRTVSGGATINDVMTHAYAEELPFGGVGPSGLGCYHGRAGFQTFSHARSVYRQSGQQEAAMLVRAPYTDATRDFLARTLDG